jgi:MFS family permease
MSDLKVGCQSLTKPPTESTPCRVDEETPLLAQNGLSNGTTTREQAVAPEELSTTRLAIIIGSCNVGVFLGALDVTILATLTSAISTSFSSQELFAWLATAYLIANAACQPISGRLTDIFSRKTGLLVSNALFAIGNLMCGLARSEGMMISGRFVAGMGGGGVMAVGTFLASDLIPLRKRGLVQGLGNIAYGTGSGIGGLFGGWINDNWGWRVAFLIQVPLSILSGALVYKFVSERPKCSRKSKLARIDFLGVFTLMTFLLLLLLGLNSGGNLVPWSHPLVLTALPLSAVALAVFMWNELYWAKEPVIPVRLLLNRTVAAACLTNWFLPGAYFSMLKFSFILLTFFPFCQKKRR